MTSIDKQISELKEAREHYRYNRDNCVMGSSDFFFYVSLIYEVDEKIEALKEQT